MPITADDIRNAIDEWDAPGGEDETAWDRLIIKERWPNGIECPNCGCKKYYILKSKQFKCANKVCTKKKFSLISGTVMENIKMSKASFFVFVIEVMTEKDGSRIVVNKDGSIRPKELNVFTPGEIVVNFGYRYTTAFYILKKIRANIKDGKFYLNRKV